MAGGGGTALLNLPTQKIEAALRAPRPASASASGLGKAPAAARRATSRAPQISQAHPVTQRCGALRPDRLPIVPLAAAATMGAPWRSRRKTIWLHRPLTSGRPPGFGACEQDGEEQHAGSSTRRGSHVCPA